MVHFLSIHSGGQTGADRAALDFALEHNFPVGGWCPAGRRAEDGRIPDLYPLKETRSERYGQRTAWNVRDTDATVVFTISPELRGGTALTVKLARRLGKPWLHLARDAIAGVACDGGDRRMEHARRLQEFLGRHGVGRLNVAGPRASQEPEIGQFVGDVLAAALR